MQLYKGIENMKDLRDELFKGFEDRQVTSILFSNEVGIFSGLKRIEEASEKLNLNFRSFISDGEYFEKGSKLVEVTGSPVSITKAEDVLIGAVSKGCGIATRTRKAKNLAGNKLRVVSGGLKKLPYEIKELAKEAVTAGGGVTSIADEPFLYLDKNYIKIFGSIRNALIYTKNFNDRTKVVQIKGLEASIENEALEASQGGAGIIMIDTGNIEDVDKVSKTLKENNMRAKIRIAFSGGIRMEQITNLKSKDIDILDIGKEILDAPWIDMKFEVVKIEVIENGI